MEAVTCNPFIVEKILDHLPMIDIYRCRLVSKVWFEEADRKINRHSIESCRLSRKINVDDLAEKHDMALEYLIRILGLKIKHHPMLWEDIKEIKNFFDGMRCCPSLTLIASNASFFDYIIPTPIHHPAIMIKDMLLTRSPYAFAEHLRLEALSKNLKLFEAFLKVMHINRFASKHKIIIKEFIPRRRVKRNLEDPEFPIQAFVFLARGTVNSHTRFCKFEEYHGYSDLLQFALDSGAKVSGGATNKNSREVLFINGHKRRKPRGGLCIAFAGKEVKSAVFNYLRHSEFVPNEQDIDSRLEEFKRSLSFPTDDGNVIGFLFTTPDSDFPSKILGIVSRVFPMIFPFRIFPEFMFNDTIGATLHLIRVSE